MDFKDKVVIVTGSSSGIGAVTAVEFAKLGAKVSLVGRNEERLIKVAEQCASVGPKPLIIKADVSNEDDAKRIIDETIKHFGKLNVLVNNAGVIYNVDIDAKNAMETYDKIINTNLRSVIVLTRLAIKHLSETKGNIINISSIASLNTSPYWAYSASKAALDHFSRSMAMNLADRGIRVNVVNPGPVKTDMLFGLFGSGRAVLEGIKQHSPLKLVTEPEEIAGFILFLASDKARSVTGSSYVCDGGSALVKSI